MINIRKFWLAGTFCAGIVLSSPALALAQRGNFRDLAPAPRTTAKFLSAFQGAGKEVTQSTVRILGDDKEVALGTVVGPDGWILTKYSQLKGKTACKLPSGTKLDAKIVGVHEAFDVALLKVEKTDLKPVTFADSSVAPVGNWVVSVGTGETPVAVGVMSVATRTPPPVNNRGPGRSFSAPPPDLLGVSVVHDGSMARVVRVTGQGPAAKAGIKIDDQILSVQGTEVTDQVTLSAVLAKQKIGDLVAIKIIRAGAEQEMKAKLEAPKPPDALGISVAREGKTIKVAEVLPSSAAARANVHKGDEIVSVSGKTITDQESLLALLAKMRPGESVTIKVLREGKELDLKAQLRNFGQRGGRRGPDQNLLGSELSEKRTGFPTFFQTDTVIKPKDCGGPICDLEGHVLGINIARAGRVESYSIPSSSIKAMLPELKSGKLAPELVALRKKIADLKAQVKKVGTDKAAAARPAQTGAEAGKQTTPASVDLVKQLQVAQEALEKAEKSLSEKK
jgi:serine protease Do